MASDLFYLPSQLVQGRLGFPAGAARVFFFYSGTTTKAPTYSDADLTLPAANPAIADAYGRIAVTYLRTDLTYRIRVVDAHGVPLGEDVDPYAPGSISGLISIENGTGKVLSLDADGNVILADLSDLFMAIVLTKFSALMDVWLGSLPDEADGDTIPTTGAYLSAGVLKFA